MKKLLVVLLVALGLQTQAQVSYCDSLSYSVVPGTQTLTTIGDASSLLNLADSVSWIWQACNATMCYSANGTPATFFNILSTDTVKVCYDAYIYFMGATYICTDCDSLVYDGNSYSWVLLNMGNPTAIEEFERMIPTDRKIYDLLGRELTEGEVKLGQMYIRNNKKHIRVK